MVKTTVYLPDEQAQALRRIAEATSQTQEQFIRDAIEEKLSAAAVQPPPRRFRSAGVGHGSGAPIAEHADEILRRELGRSPR